MKRDSIIFWVSTAIVCLMMAFSGYAYFTNEGMKAAFVHLGFPSYFREELGVAKLLGVLALLIPMVPAKVKDFAYAGFVIIFVSAIIAHLSSGDGMGEAIMPLVLLGLLGVSYTYRNKLS